jgi:hypothetical protein
MREATKRIQRTALQLTVTDRLLESVDKEYQNMRHKLLAVPSYQDFLNVLYDGQANRQMVLGDLFEYIITGRGYWLATEGEKRFKDYIRIVLYLVNLVLIQESVFSFRAPERTAILKKLREKEIEGFFASQEEKDLYKELEGYTGRISVTGETRRLYKIMDSITPKPIGVAIELIVYTYLLNRRIGYIVPLLLTQTLLGGRVSMAPPDYLLLPGHGKGLGIEVGGGMGQYSLQQGKIDQVNLFIQETGLPVATAGVPHIYRCETCQCWITFCDEVIERTAEGECTLESISCVDCPKFRKGRCQGIIYYGQTEVKGQRRRHHYYHFKSSDYVNQVGLAKDESRSSKLIQYFPVVKGLEGFLPLTKQ